MEQNKLYDMIKIRYRKDKNDLLRMQQDFKKYFNRRRAELKKSSLAAGELNNALYILCDIAKDDWEKLNELIKKFDMEDPYYFAEKYELYQRVHEKYTGTSTAKTVVFYNLFKKRFNDQREANGKKPVPFAVLDKILMNLINEYSLFSTFAADVFKLEKGEGRIMDLVKQDNLESFLFNNKAN